MRIGKEEIFRPVASVMRAKDFDEAVEMINKSNYGNVAYNLETISIKKSLILFFIFSILYFIKILSLMIVTLRKMDIFLNTLILIIFKLLNFYVKRGEKIN